MKIALMMENSQASKNAIIYNELVMLIGHDVKEMLIGLRQT